MRALWHTHTHINKEWQYTYIILFSLILILLFWIIYKECFGSFSSLNTQAHLGSLKNIFAYLLLAFFCKHMGASCGCIHVSTHYRFNIVPHFWPFSSVCNNIQQANSGRPIWQNSCIALEWKIKESLDSAEAFFLENDHWYPRTTVFLFLRIITICQKEWK